MQSVVLRNRDRFRMFSATLYHSIVCARAGQCFCLRRERMEPDRKGEYILAERSIFIPPRGLSEPLPVSALEVPQVKAAIEQTRQLVVVEPTAQVQVISGKKE